MVYVEILVHQGITSLPFTLPLRHNGKIQPLHRRSPNIVVIGGMALRGSKAASTPKRPVLARSKSDPLPYTSKQTTRMPPKSNSPSAMSEKAKGKQPERPLSPKSAPPPQPLYPTQGELDRIKKGMPNVGPSNALEKEVKKWGFTGIKDPSKAMGSGRSNSGIASSSSTASSKMITPTSSTASHTGKGGAANSGVSGSGNAAGQGLTKTSEVTTKPPITPTGKSPPTSAAPTALKNDVPPTKPETPKVTNNGISNPGVTRS
ncbi:hypothetical protein IWQ62_004325, partial [Dispira parvispora]